MNKPRGMTSRAVVDRVARLVGRAKVGHAGTLDPLATGVLVVCVGPATRLVEEIQRLPKSYRTVVLPGCAERHARRGRTDRAPRPIPTVPSPDEIDGRIAPLVGEVDQMPPEFSALKVRGRRAYDLARAGQAVELAPRGSGSTGSTCFATSGPAWSWRSIAARGPTFARSPATSARRSAAAGSSRSWSGPGSGRSRSRTAVDLDALSAESFPGLLRPPLEAVAGLAPAGARPRQVAADAAGRRLAADDLAAISSLPPGQVALVDPDGRLVALAESNPAERMDPAAQGLCPISESGMRRPNPRRRPSAEPLDVAAVSDRSNIATRGTESR